MQVNLPSKENPCVTLFILSLCSEASFLCFLLPKVENSFRFLGIFTQLCQVIIQIKIKTRKRLIWNTSIIYYNRVVFMKILCYKLYQPKAILIIIAAIFIMNWLFWKSSNNTCRWLRKALMISISKCVSIIISSIQGIHTYFPLGYKIAVPSPSAPNWLKPDLYNEFPSLSVSVQ